VKRVPGTWEHGEPPMPQQVSKEEARPIVERLQRFGSTAIRVYRMGACNIFIAREPAAVDGSMLWHLTISRMDRHPTWDEIKAARYWLLDETLTFGMLLPPPANYINVPAQDHVFHLWEIRDPREPWTGG
jgi:adenylosuccinate synthase